MIIPILNDVSNMIRTFLDRQFSIRSEEYWYSIIVPLLDYTDSSDEITKKKTIKSLDDLDSSQLLRIIAKKYNELGLNFEDTQYAYNLIYSRNLFAHETKTPIHFDRYINFKREINAMLSIVKQDNDMHQLDKIHIALDQLITPTGPQYYQHEDLMMSISRPHHNDKQLKISIQKIYQKIEAGEYPFSDVYYTADDRKIHSCVKYKLTDRHILITVYAGNICLLCFVGDTHQINQWMNNNENFTIAIDNTYKRIIPIRVSSDKLNKDNATSSLIPDYTQGSIIERLSPDYLKKIKEVITVKTAESIKLIESTSSLDDIRYVSLTANDEDVQKLLYDILQFLVSGKLSLAEGRIDLYLGNSTLISELSQNEILTIKDGKYIKQITTSQWIEHFFENADYQSWMLFMHPEQDEIVCMDFSGPAKLSGVSGSGKTCVIVNRAIRLASEIQEPEQKILVLTLNDNLADLINSLICYACPQNLIQNIECISLRAFAIKWLDEFEPQDSKHHKSSTWKMKEHIDEIWREFYKLEVNNRDAEILFPIHSSLLARGIFPEDYIRQEFDYIRSALPYEEREEYLSIKRIGRAIPISKQWRMLILTALSKWETKMSDIGIMDDFARIDRLPKYKDRLPKYHAVLVDEAQDFSTNEFRIVRNLVELKANDIFLAADMKQRIAHKHQNMQDTGIILHGTRSKTLKVNYRNGRAILEAAQKMYEAIPSNELAVNLELGFEILEPVLSDFMVPKPLILEADTLQDELHFAYSHAEQILSFKPSAKVCIVVVGFTLFELGKFAQMNSLNILDSDIINKKSIFISDMEHVKGYEFDTLMVLNMCHSVFPDNNIPSDEIYREYNRLYVAMTRAKKELIISYHQDLSQVFRMETLLHYFSYEKWSNVLEKNTNINYRIPQKMPEYTSSKKPVLQLNGEKFLYTKYATGFSITLQNYIRKHINGKGRKNELSWNTILECYNYLYQHQDKTPFKIEHDFFMKRIKEIKESHIH